MQGCGVGAGFFCPTPDVQFDHFLRHTPKLGILVEMVVSFETFVGTEISCCAPRFPFIVTVEFHSLYVKESESEILERSELESDILPPTPQPCWHALLSYWHTSEESVFSGRTLIAAPLLTRRFAKSFRRFRAVFRLRKRMRQALRAKTSSWQCFVTIEPPSMSTGAQFGRSTVHELNQKTSRTTTQTKHQ